MGMDAVMEGLGTVIQRGMEWIFNLPREVRKKPDGLLQICSCKRAGKSACESNKKEKFVLEEQETEIKAGDGICYEIKFNLEFAGNHGRSGRDKAALWRRKKYSLPF